MLIPIEKLPMGKVNGIIHIGAHEAEELESYLLCGIRRVAWIEANPEKTALIESKIEPFNQMTLGCFAAGSQRGRMTLNIANNGQSSSLLDFGTHQTEHPEIVFTTKVEVEVLRVDDYLDSNGLRRSDYNFMNLDIQGYELYALKGAVKQLPYTDFIYSEINTKELYSGCPLVDEMDSFLEAFGFFRIQTAMTPHGWGDALYFKASP